MTDTVFAQGKQKRACPHATKAVVFKTGYEHKQTLTNNQSCQRKRDAVLHALHNFTADDAIAPARWSFKIESCIFSPAKCSSIFRSCIFRNIGPANSGPAFPVLHFQRSPTATGDIMSDINQQKFKYVHFVSRTLSTVSPQKQRNLWQLHIKTKNTKNHQQPS